MASMKPPGEDEKEEREGRLFRLARAIADGTPVDWGAERRGARSDPELDSLELLEAIGGSRGTDPEASAPTVPADSPEEPSTARRDRTPFPWGPLEVMERVGSGGFGDVYRARDPRLDREVALKLRPLGSREERAGAKRFLEEARRLARVRHANVVTVHGADIHDGRVGLWMDFVRGRTLEARLAEEGPLAAQEAALIGLDLCRALAAVHGSGLVHGDVKLANVMREQGGRILLMDFGAASEHFGSGKSPLFYTPLFAAPEVIAREPTGPAADLYSLGVVLFHLVSGRYPVQGTTPAEVARKHASGERTSLRDVRSDLPPAFVQVVERALAPEPSDRFPTAGTMEAALSACLGPGVAPPPAPLDGATPPRRRLPRRAAVTTALVVAAAVAAALWGTLRGPHGESGPGDAPSIAVLPLLNESEDPGGTEYLARGIGQAVITKLTQAGLRVTPWVTAARYADSPAPIPEIARELNVESVLVGTFQVLDDRIVSTLSLVDARSGLQTWARQFDAPARDLLHMQRRIATGAALHLKGRLTGPERAVLERVESRNVDAYDFYLQGAHIMQEGNEEASGVARSYFERALELDPELAEAHVGLGAVHTSQYFFGWGQGTESLAEAEAHYLTALSLRPELTAARRGLIRIEWERGASEACIRETGRVAGDSARDPQVPLARAEGYTLGGLPELAAPLLQDAIALDPANEAAHWFLTIALAWSGDHAGAIDAGETYVGRFGEDVEIRTWIAVCHHAMGDLPQARAAYDRAVGIEKGPTGANLRALLLAGHFYRQLGESALAERTWRAGIDLVEPRLAAFPDNLRLRLFLAAYLVSLGRTAEAREQEVRAREAGLNALEFYFLAVSYAGVGDAARAAALLGTALEHGRAYAPWDLLLGVVGASPGEAVYESFRTRHEHLVLRLREIEA